MKRTIALSLLLLMALSIVGCQSLPEDLTVCTVDFYIDGELYDSKTTFLGQPIMMPKFPSKENQVFVGWYIKGVSDYQYDFSLPVFTNLELHAEFVLDATALTNMLTLQTMKSVVTIFNKCYNTGMGGLVELNSQTSQGSGVVVDISGGYCYVLTNAHVVYHNEAFNKQTMTVEDPWGNEYQAYVYQSSKSTPKAMDVSYDLALIYFEYKPEGDVQLAEIELAEDPKVGDYVVALGSPLNQKNAISYGEVLDYRLMTNVDDSVADVRFEIILHDAVINHGSSGGPLLNASGKLIGLNFAGYEANGFGCAIPISKINEFMNKYIYGK